MVGDLAERITISMLHAFRLTTLFFNIDKGDISNVVKWGHFYWV